ncbi:DUF4270 domain-containing protein [Luteirhabdus pelagi]|uniref:DUF4270 domain-containing protein n=1 Tax=Luteirhabdus pelagi TaxID=2792783 RepID=UPI00193A2AEA|nr:DUF4270 domain-containing protein [Luteirhabdus pelagi]
MKRTHFLPGMMALIVAITFFASCEEDFDVLGSEIVGDNTLIQEPDETKTVVAYNKILRSVQSNGLSSYQLGTYYDPVYGKTTSNYLTQVLLSSTEPTFGNNATLDSVSLYIPYYSQSTTDGEDTTFELDSVYGEESINISIYESNYFLRDLDPNSNFEKPQKYYSNQGSLFESSAQLGELIYEISDFVPNDEAIDLVEEVEGQDSITETLDPGLRVLLPTEYFQEKIIDQEGSNNLISNSNFRDYLRGLYFKVNNPNNEGNMFLFNPIANPNAGFPGAYITLYYTYQLEPEEVGDPPVFEQDSFRLNLYGGIGINTFNTELNQDVVSAIENQDSENGTETLYLKGGPNIAAIINLFGEDLDGNGVADELEDLRDRELLVNEANLIFYVDQEKVSPLSTEPERIMIFDATNGTVLIDYVLDPTVASDPSLARTLHLEPLQRDSDENGDYYKVRISTHVSNLINNDSTNVPLGLVVTNNVNISNFRSVRNTGIQGPMQENLQLQEIPGPALLSPYGTVLHGNNSPDEEKRLKLQLYYTEPN